MDFTKLRVGDVLRFHGKHPMDVKTPPMAKYGGDTRYQEEVAFPDHLKQLGPVYATPGSVVLRQIPKTNGAPIYPAGPLDKVLTFVKSNFSDRKSKHESIEHGAVGSCVAEYVGYADGTTQYIQSQRTVFSTGFSGCLMVAYRDRHGRRHVAHAAANGDPRVDCKKKFIHDLHQVGSGRTLIGWFRPFEKREDSEAQFGRMNALIKKKMIDFRNLERDYVVLGVMDQNNNGFAVEGFRPTHLPAPEWKNYFIITSIRHKPLKRWVEFFV